MSQRVLIIDDEEHIRQMMRLTLEAAGYAVGEAQDGPEGIRLYGDGSTWDGVVLDQRMPGMDGLETLRSLVPLISCASQGRLRLCGTPSPPP